MGLVILTSATSQEILMHVYVITKLLLHTKNKPMFIGPCIIVIVEE